MLIVAIKKKKEGGRENEIYFCELMHLSECVQTIFFIFTFIREYYYFIFYFFNTPCINFRGGGLEFMCTSTSL